MADEKAQPAENDPAPDLQKKHTSNQAGMVRLELKKGALTETHRHDTECLVIVLKGACRIHMRGQAVMVCANEMLHIPPQHEHFAEALSDTVALSISPSAGEWAGCGPFLPEDPDEYLWGV